MKLPIYLDHNASTPLDPEVFERMRPYFLERFGNPSSVDHAYGHEAAEGVEGARLEVATLIGARPEEIVFTGTCTEANNLAIQGVALANPDKAHFITTTVEHPSVLETFRWLERVGKQVTYVPVDEYGQVDADAVKRCIRDDTCLVSVMGANNEVGTTQPIAEIGEICESRGVLFHSDLAQLAPHCRVNVQHDHLHLASLSAHKAYGPKGIGALYVRSRSPRARVAPHTFGGGQERGLRSGTLNTPAIVGMGAAFTKVGVVRGSEAPRILKLSEELLHLLRDQVSGVTLNGHPEERLPNNLSITIDGVEPHALIRNLRETVSFSAASACSTRDVRTSHVLHAMFGETPRARNAFRLAVGRFTTPEDIAVSAAAIVSAAVKLRSAVHGAARPAHSRDAS